MCAGSLVQTYKLLVHALRIIRLRCDGGKHSMSNRKEGRKWRENTNQKAPEDFPISNPTSSVLGVDEDLQGERKIVDLLWPVDPEG